MKDMLGKTTLILLNNVLVLFLFISIASAKIVTEEVQYTHQGEKLTGYIAWDDTITKKRPGILIVHEWWGLNDYVRQRARMLAGLGYVAMAADMYGAGKVTTHPSQAKAWSEQVTNNVKLWRGRAMKGLTILTNHTRVDPNHIAAIGYCFGGSTVMQMAYGGADIKGVVSFHGSLPVATEKQARSVKTKILAHHGSRDEFVPHERVQKWHKSLDKAGVDWQLVVHGGARHGFTNPDADAFGIPNVSYDKKADLRSWKDMQRFFGELFTP